MSKIPPDNENFQTIRLLHHSLVSPLKNPLPPINQTAKVCFATIEGNHTFTINLVIFFIFIRTGNPEPDTV